MRFGNSHSLKSLYVARSSCPIFWRALRSRRPGDVRAETIEGGATLCGPIPTSAPLRRMRFIHSGEELWKPDHLPSNVRIAGGFHRDFSVAAHIARG